MRTLVKVDKQKKGARISISRRARSRGFKVDFREDTGAIKLGLSFEEVTNHSNPSYQNFQSSEIYRNIS